jgi:hypothetical protein
MILMIRLPRCAALNLVSWWCRKSVPRILLRATGVAKTGWTSSPLGATAYTREEAEKELEFIWNAYKNLVGYSDEEAHAIAGMELISP